MRRRILSMLMAVCIMATLAACGGNGGSGGTGGESTGTGGSETIKLICPYGVGGTADAILRRYALVAGKLNPDKNFIVVNMTGGDGFAACSYYTELDSSTTDLIQFGYGAAYRHDLGKEFNTEVVDWDRNEILPIACIDDRTWILYAQPGTTLEDVIEKAQNGGVKMSGGNPLSDPHLALGSLISLLNGSVMVVPYDGGATQIKGLKDGEVDVFVGTTQAGQDEVEAGNIVPILSFSTNAFTGFVGPDGSIDIPTVSGPDKADVLPANIDFSDCILPGGGFVATRAGASQEWIDEITEISKAVWADEEFYGWIDEIMLNYIDQYNEDCVAAVDIACARAKDAFLLLS